MTHANISVPSDEGELLGSDLTVNWTHVCLHSLVKASCIYILLKHAMLNLRYLDYGTIVAGMGLGKRKRYSKTA